MYVFVMIVFIFSIGAIFGWGLEVIYRHLADKQKRWFNPGFCVGPWLPIYGIGLTSVYVLTYMENIISIDNLVIKRLILFLLMSICVTLIELIAGIFLLKVYNLRLWDYRDEFMNYKGFICLKFSIFWILLCALYYFLIHPHIKESVLWLSHNLIFSFVVGFFFGVFIIDVIYSGNVVSKIREQAVKRGVIVRLEEIKDKVQREKKINDAKAAFFLFLLKEDIEKIYKLYK